MKVVVSVGRFILDGRVRPGSLQVVDRLANHGNIVLIEDQLRDLASHPPAELRIAFDVQRTEPDVGHESVELHQQATITLVGDQTVLGIGGVAHRPDVDLEVGGAWSLGDEVGVVIERAGNGLSRHEQQRHKHCHRDHPRFSQSDRSPANPRHRPLNPRLAQRVFVAWPSAES